MTEQTTGYMHSPVLGNSRAYMGSILTTPVTGESTRGRFVVIEVRGKPSTEPQEQDIPGTNVFTVERSQRGYRLNQLAMSLMISRNRERFLADEVAYMRESWTWTTRKSRS